MTHHQLQLKKKKLFKIIGCAFNAPQHVSICLYFWWSVRIRGRNFAVTLVIAKSSVRILYTEPQEISGNIFSSSMVRRQSSSTSIRIMATFSTVLYVEVILPLLKQENYSAHLSFALSIVLVSSFQH